MQVHPHNQFFELVGILRFHRYNWYRSPHQGVARILLKGYRPRDWHLLALEMPAVPENEDSTRVSYWQSDAKQAKNLRTVTSLGKYLKRHFPELADHEIRDAVALAAPAKFEIWTGTEKMVQAVQEGPASCMKWDEDFDVHPYEVYEPQYGWGVAVRLQGPVIMGRCVVHTEKKIYVRSYGRQEHDGRSQDDNALESWLDDQGYSYREYWPEGVKFAKIEYRDHYIMPYLDGSSADYRRVDVRSGCIVRDSDGDYVCDNTNGEMTHEARQECDHCGSSVDEDEVTWVESVEESVCQHCIERHFTWVRGTAGMSNGRTAQYYVRDHEAVSVDGENYDENNLPDYIRELHNGEFSHEDNCVLVESEDEYYSDSDVGNRKNGDSLVVRLDSGEYELRENAAYCEHNDEWYPIDDCREFNDGEFCLEQDVDSYLVGLSEAELREKLDDEEVEKVMASEEWAYFVNHQQEAQMPLPLPVPEPVKAEAPKAVDADFAKLEERVLADMLKGRVGAQAEGLAALMDSYRALGIGHVFDAPFAGFSALSGTATGRMVQPRPEITFYSAPSVIRSPDEVVRINNI